MKKSIKMILNLVVILILIIAGILVIYNSVSHNSYENSYKKVSKLVNENREEIESIVQQVKNGKYDSYCSSVSKSDYEDWESASNIIKFMKKNKINQISKEENDIIFFMDKLASLETGEGICGFYYSFNDKPVAIQNDGKELQQKGNAWKVIFNDKDSYLKMERIDKNIFFFDGTDFV